MENTVGKADREFIWSVMSEFFVDSEIDYDFEAARIRRFPAHVLKDIFFREVAPVCGPNLLTPIPPIWMGFDTHKVVREIRSLLSNKEKSWLRRIGYEADVLYYRYLLAGVWREVERALKRDCAGQARPG